VPSDRAAAGQRRRLRALTGTLAAGKAPGAGAMFSRSRDSWDRALTSPKRPGGDGGREDNEGAEGLQRDAPHEGTPVVFKINAVLSRRHRDGDVAAVGDEERRPISVEARPPGGKVSPRKNQVPGPGGADLNSGRLGLDSHVREHGRAPWLRDGVLVRSAGKHDLVVGVETVGPDALERRGEGRAAGDAFRPSEFRQRVGDL